MASKWISEHALIILISILVLAVVLVGVVVYNYPFHFRGFPSGDKEAIASWGQMGDFFGGTLNPIFGFLSIIALLTALVIQGRELKISSEELKKSSEALDAQNKAIAHQSFEQTFFSWLKSYSELLDSVATTVHAAVERQGRRALFKWWEEGLSDVRVFPEVNAELPEAFRAKLVFQNTEEKKLYAIAEKFPNAIPEYAIKKWNKIYGANEYQLDNLFRNLYSLIRWIDSQNDSRVNLAQKWFYVSIVRAQLSWIEMVYLFYNGYTERGSKFKLLVEKYALFDNLNLESDSVIRLLRQKPPANLSYADSAFDSCLARKKMGLSESSEEVLKTATIGGNAITERVES